ncbi:MAG: hypothetical protein H6Q86_4344, partial [candidate division NC10 bacterium]|nr:hypothetical protein [candidate division NC10 bacterium]
STRITSMDGVAECVLTAIPPLLALGSPTLPLRGRSHGAASATLPRQGLQVPQRVAERAHVHGRIVGEIHDGVTQGRGVAKDEDRPTVLALDIQDGKVPASQETGQIQIGRLVIRMGNFRRPPLHIMPTCHRPPSRRPFGTYAAADGRSSFRGTRPFTACARPRWQSTGCSELPGPGTRCRARPRTPAAPDRSGNRQSAHPPVG